MQQNMIGHAPTRAPGFGDFRCLFGFAMQANNLMAVRIWL